MPDGRKLFGRQSALHNAVRDAALFVETGLESALLDFVLFDEMLFFAFVSCVRAGVKAKAPAMIDATAVSSNLFMFQLPRKPASNLPGNPHHAISRNRNPILK